MNFDRDVDVDGLVVPAEVGSDCVEDYGNGGKFDCSDGWFLNSTRHDADYQPADLYTDDSFD